MARSKSDLAAAVLRDLAILAADEAPDAADKSSVEKVYEEKYEEWNDDSLVYWPENEIPLAIFRTIVALVANESGPAFGRGRQSPDRQEAEKVLLKRLRRHVAKVPSGMPARAVYY